MWEIRARKGRWEVGGGKRARGKRSLKGNFISVFNYLAKWVRV
jgi:hypothetical protein